MSADGPINLNSSNEDILAVRKLADEVGIQISGLATGLYWEHNAVGADKETRANAAKVLNRQIHAAKLLGTDSILVIPGYVGCDFIPGAPEVAYDTAYGMATDFIASALPFAQENGITIGIENVWNKFLLSPLELRDFIDQFQSKYVASYFDVGNVLINGYPEHWISILGDRIRRVHFKDFRRAVGTIDGFVELLSGDVNWPAVIQALGDINYTSWVTAEMIPPIPFYKHAPEVLISNTGAAMSKLLNM